MKKNIKGFTLIELLAVIAIMGILIGIIAPNVTKTIRESRRKAEVQSYNAIITEMKNDLALKMPITAIPTCDDNGNTKCSATYGTSTSYKVKVEAGTATTCGSTDYSLITVTLNNSILAENLTGVKATLYKDASNRATGTTEGTYVKACINTSLEVIEAK